METKFGVFKLSPLRHSWAMSEPAGSQAMIYALIDLATDLADETNRLIDATLGELGLTHVLANVLWRLDPHARPPSMRSLAAMLDCDPSTVTTLAERLEDKGLLLRRIEPQNRRRKAVVLTPAGMDTRRRLVAAMLTRSPMARLTADEQAKLRDLLTKALQPDVP